MQSDISALSPVMTTASQRFGFRSSDEDYYWSSPGRCFVGMTLLACHTSLWPLSWFGRKKNWGLDLASTLAEMTSPGVRKGDRTPCSPSLQPSSAGLPPSPATYTGSPHLYFHTPSLRFPTWPHGKWGLLYSMCAWWLWNHFTFPFSKFYIEYI